MARYRYFEHSDPSGRSVFQRIADCGFKSRLALGENIAAGQRTPQSVFRAWLNSPGHRRNIEYPSFRYIGVGAVHRAAPSVRLVLDPGLRSLSLGPRPRR